MPKYRPETDRLKAKSLAKSCIKANLNQSEVARQEGVSHQAINQRVNRPIVQKTFAEMMDKAGMPDSYLRKKLKEGMEAQKVVGYLNSKVDGVEKVSDEFVDVPDMPCRHKYLVTALEVKGHIKHNGKGGVGVSAIILNITNPDRLLTKAQAELVS